jgi:predicted nucleic acid-binding protein
VLLYLDANAIIIAHEGARGLQRTVVERIIEACLSPSGLIVTSRLSQLECRVRPLREKTQPLLSHYDFLFAKSGLQVIEISSWIVERATALRADYNFRTPDAIHLATALEFGADRFLTRDKGLTRCPGLRVELIDQP